MNIAKMVQSIVGEDVKIVRTETDDNRSYHISSEKIKKDLGFVPKYTVEDAIHELVAAFNAGTIQNSMTDSRYFNVKLMQEIELA
jgi:nucleoside-diphosphate-sugar epimerase